MIKNCLYCNKEITTNIHLQRYCSKECQQSRGREMRGMTSNFKGIPPGTVGAIQELRVSIDLLAKGWEVYRALSPSSSCDLLALKNGMMIKLEVRTGYKGVDTPLIYSKRNIKAEYIAVTIPEKIIYIPDLPYLVGLPQFARRNDLITKGD